jgi:outer membrane protein assembly factor BamB
LIVNIKYVLNSYLGSVKYRRKRKMNFDKTKTACIILILMLTFSATILALPVVSAHDPPLELPTWTYLTAFPTPVGIGQTIIVTWALHIPPPTSNGAYGDRWTFTVEVTKPDGTKQDLGTFTSDPIGGGYTLYTPDTVGTYYFQAFFHEQVLAGDNPHPDPDNPYNNSPYIGDTFLASKSELLPVVVQQEQLTSFEPTPLPTGYWTRPIYATNREWSTIAGNWLQNSINSPYSSQGLNMYTTGPETAHIMWTKPLDDGGIIGGSVGDISYYTGSSYEAKWSPPIIMQGRLYYNQPLSDKSYSSRDLSLIDGQALVCVDLRTGEELWRINGLGVDMGVIYDYESPNQHGAIPYLLHVGSTWTYYHPFTGAFLYNITNVPSGTAAVGRYGEGLIYRWNYNAGWLACWNSTASPDMLLGEESGTNMWQWRPVGKTIDGNTCYVWNVTIPTDLPHYSRDFTYVIYDDNNAPEMIIASSGCIDRYTTNDPFTMYAISLKPGQEGQLLWRKDYALPIAGASMDPGYGIGIDSVNRVFAIPLKTTMQWYGYNMDTGIQLWGPTEAQPALDFYRMYPNAAYGKLYSGGYGGVLYAIDMTTGTVEWKSATDACGLEGPYPNWPMYSDGKLIADGKIYVTTSEHSHTQPLYREWTFYCFDAETGAGIWNITGLMAHPAIADGYIVTLDHMDLQIYCFGKGPSATSVTVKNDIIAEGDSVMITGTVTDQSPGAKGTPAIADEDMTAWMEYMYHQRPIPMDAKGVPVKLETLDPNGNFYEIGVVTSDASGMYKLMWEPPVPGEYTIIATFEVSDSYGGSFAETAIGVTEAPSPGGPIEPEPTEPTEAPFITTEVAIIAAVAIACIIGIVAFWALKRRK